MRNDRSLVVHSLFSAPEKIEMILFRGFLSSGTDGSGLELWLAERESLPEPVLKMVLLMRTGGAGGLSSESPLSHISGGCSGGGRGGLTGLRWAEGRRGHRRTGGRQTVRDGAHISMRHRRDHAAT